MTQGQEHERKDAILAALKGDGSRAGAVVEHMASCTDAGAAIVVDGNADEIIARLVADGWTLGSRVDQVAGKRIRFVTPPAITFPPATPAGWRDIARRIARGEDLPARPTVYSPATLRALHLGDRAAARAAMRTAAGWSAAPHDDDDFNAVLRIWGGADCGGGEHWVAASIASFGRGPQQVLVAHCKHCGLPVYSAGLEWRLTRSDDAGEGWRPIWPPAAGGPVSIEVEEGR